MLALLVALYPRMGIAGWRSWLLLTMLALNPYVILFSSRLLSELWFTALLAGVLLLVEKAAKTETRVAWAVAAALLAGLAYLLRSAGIVLLGSGFVYLWLRGQRRKACGLRGGHVPLRRRVDAVGAPASASHRRRRPWSITPTISATRSTTSHIHTLHLFLWKNLDGLVSSLGYLILPNVTSSLFMKILAELIGVAMISGIVRMVRSGARPLHYAIFAAGAAFMLVIWHFPPNERFVLPLVPLAFAGLLTEMEHFVGMARAGLKHREASQRVAAAVMLAFVALVFVGAFGLQAYVGGVFLGETAAQYSASATSTIAAPTPGFARICRRTPRWSPTTIRCCISTPGGAPSAVPCRRTSGTPRITPARWKCTATWRPTRANTAPATSITRPPICAATWTQSDVDGD